MEKRSSPSPESKTITVTLTADAFEILEKYRGGLSTDDFFSALLRMVDSGAVDNSPKWSPPGPGV